MSRCVEPDWQALYAGIQRSRATESGEDLDSEEQACPNCVGGLVSDDEVCPICSGYAVVKVVAV